MAEKQDLEPLLNTQQSQLDLVLSDGTAIDNKALAILASNIALLIFIAQAGLNLTAWWQFTALLGPFAISLALDCLAIWPREYHGPMVDLQKHPEYLVLSRHELQLKLLANGTNAMQHNLSLNQLRWTYCAKSMLLTAIGATLLFVILLI